MTALARPERSSQRLYAQQDANYNTTALTDASGTVVERYIYTPYGQVTVLNPDFTQRGDGSAAASAYGMTTLAQGMREDPVTETCDNEGRVYKPSLGRPLQPDPAGTVDGANLYQREVSNPIGNTDPSGLTTLDLDQTPIGNA